MSSALFRAILALDSYNRGYNSRISGLGGIDTKIGHATIIDEKGDAEAQNVSFYGIAYQIGDGENAEKIISYRGTDYLSINPFGSTPTDFPGYVIGSGDPINPITGNLFTVPQLTIDFYKAVVGDGNDPFDSNITLTGHSLGGGMAG